MRKKKMLASPMKMQIIRFVKIQSLKDFKFVEEQKIDFTGVTNN
jgi:hypothetical protein